MITYPCVVRGRIIELTASQIARAEWRQQSTEYKIDVLLVRIEALEAEIQRLSRGGRVGENPA